MSTKFFQGLAVASAKGRGMSNLQQLILPWPFDTLTEKEVRDIAHNAFDPTVAGLLQSNRPLAEIKPEPKA